MFVSGGKQNGVASFVASRKRKHFSTCHVPMVDESVAVVAVVVAVAVVRFARIAAICSCCLRLVSSCSFVSSACCSTRARIT